MTQIIFEIPEALYDACVAALAHDCEEIAEFAKSAFKEKARALLHKRDAARAKAEALARRAEERTQQRANKPNTNALLREQRVQARKEKADAAAQERARKVSLAEARLQLQRERMENQRARIALREALAADNAYRKDLTARRAKARASIAKTKELNRPMFGDKMPADLLADVARRAYAAQGLRPDGTELIPRTTPNTPHNAAPDEGAALDT